MSIENNKLLSVISELWSEAEGKSVVKVSGISMQPLLLGGESIVVDHKVRDLKFGDIGVFNKDGVMIVHRVLRRKRVSEKIIYRTKGDWLLYMDGPFESSAVMGKVTFMTRLGKRFNLNHVGSKIYSRMMALCSLIVAFFGKLFHLMDRCMFFFARGRDHRKRNDQNRFFIKIFLHVYRFHQRVFHGIFFYLFHRIDKKEDSF